MSLSVEQMQQLKQKFYFNLSGTNSSVGKGVYFGSFKQFQENAMNELKVEVTMSDYLGTYFFASPWVHKCLDGVVLDTEHRLSDRVLDMLSEDGDSEESEDLDDLTQYADIDKVLQGVVRTAKEKNENEEYAALMVLSDNSEVKQWLDKAKHKVASANIIAISQLRKAFYDKNTTEGLKLSESVRIAIQSVNPGVLTYLTTNIIDSLNRSAVALISSQKYNSRAMRIRQINDFVHKECLQKALKLDMGNVLPIYKDGGIVWQPPVLNELDSSINSIARLKQEFQADTYDGLYLAMQAAGREEDLNRVRLGCQEQYLDIKAKLLQHEKDLGELLDITNPTKQQVKQLQRAMNSLGYKEYEVSKAKWALNLLDAGLCQELMKQSLNSVNDIPLQYKQVYKLQSADIMIAAKDLISEDGETQNIDHLFSVAYRDCKRMIPSGSIAFNKPKLNEARVDDNYLDDIYSKIQENELISNEDANAECLAEALVYIKSKLNLTESSDDSNLALFLTLNLGQEGFLRPMIFRAGAAATSREQLEMWGLKENKTKPAMHIWKDEFNKIQVEIETVYCQVSGNEEALRTKVKFSIECATTDQEKAANSWGVKIIPFPVVPAVIEKAPNCSSITYNEVMQNLSQYAPPDGDKYKPAYKANKEDGELAEKEIIAKCRAVVQKAEGRLTGVMKVRVEKKAKIISALKACMSSIREAVSGLKTAIVNMVDKIQKANRSSAAATEKDEASIDVGVGEVESFADDEIKKYHEVEDAYNKMRIESLKLCTAAELEKNTKGEKIELIGSMLDLDLSIERLRVENIAASIKQAHESGNSYGFDLANSFKSGQEKQVALDKNNQIVAAIEYVNSLIKYIEAITESIKSDGNSKNIQELDQLKQSYGDYLSQLKEKDAKLQKTENFGENLGEINKLMSHIDQQLIRMPSWITNRNQAGKKLSAEEESVEQSKRIYEDETKVANKHFISMT